MSRFNTTRPTTRTVNKAGGVAFSMTPELELIHATLTTFLDDKYYESGKDRVSRLQKLVASVKPEFAAKLAIIARKEFHLRSVSHLILGHLATIHSGDDLIKRAVVAGTERPDDLLEFASYVMSHTNNKHLTKQAKRGIRNALLKFDAYQLGKYRGENKALSLVDLFNIVHPKVEHATPEQAQAWKDLLEGNLKASGTWETSISNSTAENRAEAWEDLVMSGKIGYMALLRNLNNLIKNDVSQEVIAKAAAILRDPERVLKSKQLPFRFYTAYTNVKGNRVLSDAISEALDISVANAPEFDGRTLIAVDSSGSMSGGAITHAALIAASIFKKNPQSDVVLYDTKVVDFIGSGRTPVIDLLDKMKKQAMGGGTETSLVFRHAAKSGKNYDRIVIISDNESWREGYYGRSVQGAYLDYKKQTNTDPSVFCIDIQGYGTKDIEHTNVFHVAGFSDRILDFIGKIEKSESLVEYVKNYKL